MYLLPTLLVCAGAYLATVSSSISVVDTGLFVMRTVSRIHPDSRLLR